MSSALEQLQAATLSLARAGSIKDRLTEAYRNHLSHLEEGDLPNELREGFRSLNSALARERPLLRGEDAFRATVRKMSSEEATEVASAIVRMYGAVSREAAIAARAIPMSNVVPLYLAEGR